MPANAAMQAACATTIPNDFMFSAPCAVAGLSLQTRLTVEQRSSRAAAMRVHRSAVTIRAAEWHLFGRRPIAPSSCAQSQDPRPGTDAASGRDSATAVASLAPGVVRLDEGHQRI